MPIPQAAVAPAYGVDSAGYIIVRSVVFTTLLLVVGVGVFRHLTLRVVRRRGSRAGTAVAAPAERRALAIAAAAAAVLLLAVLGRFTAQLVVTGADAATLLRSPWGWSWLLQLGATLVVLASYLSLRRTGRGVLAAGVATLVLAVTPMLAGHAIAAPRFAPLTVLAGSIHVLGASGWLGTLAVILLAGVPAAKTLDGSDRAAAVAELVNAFSPVALVCAALVTASGTFVSWVHLGANPARWHGDYSWWLLVKLGVLSTVVAVGLYNWRLVRPSLGDDDATARLQRYATLELVVAVAVVVITAILVAVPLPHQLGAAAR